MNTSDSISSAPMKPAPNSSMARLAERKRTLAARSRGSIGAERKRWEAQKPTASSSVSWPSHSTFSEPQPCRLPWLRVSTSVHTPPASSTMPSQSTFWPAACGSTVSGHQRRASTSVTIPIGTLTTKIAGQPISWMSVPPSSGPDALATSAAPAISVSANPRRAAGTRARPWRSPAGRACPAPAPWIARAAISVPIVGEAAHSAEAR